MRSALFVELGVVAERRVAQQAGAVDARAAIGDAHRRPVGLAGDRAVRLQQLRAQGFLDNIVVHGQQRRIRRAVAVDVHVEIVDRRRAVVGLEGRQAELDRHRRAGPARDRSAAMVSRTRSGDSKRAAFSELR